MGLAFSSSGFAAPAILPALAKTRVWGFGFENPLFPWGWSAVSSTSRWGYWPAYDRIVSDRLDQRYFAGSLGGRFLSSDPYEASGDSSAPGSWNRYPYVGGDPVNFVDPKGLQQQPADFSVTGYGLYDPWLPGFPDKGQLFVEVGIGGGSGGGGGFFPEAAQVMGPWLPSKIATTDPSRRATLQTAIDRMRDILLDNSECAKALTPASAGVAAVGTALATIAATEYRILDIPSRRGNVAAATVSPTSVFVNSGGMFFGKAPDESGNVTFFLPGVDGPGPAHTLSQIDFQAFLLLHELGHQHKVFGPDAEGRGGVNGNRNNSLRVLENCF